MIKRVLIVGEPPFVDSLYNLCVPPGFKIDLYHVEDLDDEEILEDMVRDAARCDVFVESLNESPASKLWLIQGVEANLKERTPLLTNCLCTTATEVASWCDTPQRVVGFGLIPPIRAPGVVEFVPSLQADFQSAATAREFFEKIGLELVRVPDAPGLVRARIVCSMINEAIMTLDAEIATAEHIDTAIKGMLGTSRGLLAWADEIGLDVVLGTLNGMRDFWGDARFNPAPLLKQKVRAGHLGKKTGRGFFIDPITLEE